MHQAGEPTATNRRAIDKGGASPKASLLFPHVLFLTPSPDASSNTQAGALLTRTLPPRLFERPGAIKKPYPSGQE